ncbi:MAG: diacylglycerol kinase family protein [Verrucomicrobia bacterium]|nr:diacylglycerol kinase family protein [Verrucomicrobiota bacterium]
MLSSLFRSFRCAFAGIGWALRTQRNLRIHALATAVVTVLGFGVNLPAWKWCAVLGCISLVWMAELMNSALEILCDRITTEPDEHIRRAKDASAGAVLVSAIISIVIATLVFL